MKDPSALVHLSKDKQLNKIIPTISLPPLEASGDVYLDLLDAIVSQQISTHAARAIFNRFCALFPNHYPAPENVLSLSQETMRSVGLSAQKAAYIRNIASFSAEENLEKLNWLKKKDDEIIQYLSAIKGVGKWTVEMVLIFTLGRTDVLPLDDLGIRQAFVKLYGISGTPKIQTAAMLEIASAWRPYRSLACRYLWRWNSLNKNV